MKKEELVAQIITKKSFLCVGLDPDLTKIPAFLLEFEDPIFEFNKRIIDATKEFTVAYKPNIAFYEALGIKGWISLQKTIDYIPTDIFTIADAKRGDIGNTSSAYAKAFFETMSFDSITVAPYMGADSVQPFLAYPNKWVILLALTSNQGSADFQMLELKNGERVFENVIKKAQEWGNENCLMYVIGATKASFLAEVRKLAPDYFFLVPGVGAQGGDLKEVAKYGMNDTCGLLINSSRGILYASNGHDFAEAAAYEAKLLQSEMEILLREKGICK